MKCRYLGSYIPELNFVEDEPEYTYRHVDTDDTYSQDLFMRVDDYVFDGIMSETNTSAIGVKVINEDEVKLWRIY